MSIVVVRAEPGCHCFEVLALAFTKTKSTKPSPPKNDDEWVSEQADLIAEINRPGLGEIRRLPFAPLRYTSVTRQSMALATVAPSSSGQSGSSASGNFVTKSKPAEVRRSNIIAAKAVADVIRTSLGPRGMDKMIQKGDKSKEVIVTNDGATILKHMSVLHPCSKMVHTRPIYCIAGRVI